MNRRELFYKLLGHATTVAGSGICLGCVTFPGRENLPLPPPVKKQSPVAPETPLVLPDKSADLLPSEPTAALSHPSSSLHLPDKTGIRPVSDYEKYKLRYFDQNHPGDVYIVSHKRGTLNSCYQKLSRIKKYVGYGNFNLLSFDQMLSYSGHVLGNNQFAKKELDFFEEIFYFNAEEYGFYGKKINKSLTDSIPHQSVIKIPGSGHYLHRHASLPIYRKIIKDVGDTLILTSGIRSVVKQMHLFLGKTISVNGNFSQASRSLAPPGHSYHAVGDFDVGKKGLGTSNFTSKFSETDEYKKLTDLGYIDIRYPTDNPFGVRFEPWHIEGNGRIS